MQITDSIKLKDIQEEFQQKFHFLKLEFYAWPHDSGDPSSPRVQLDPEKTIAEVRTVHKEGKLNIKGNMEVSTLEERFREHFGLNVQVFRRSGNLWLQTSATDHWTLSEQNRKGEHSEEAFREMHEE